MQAERYEVDWCEELKFDSGGDHDMDREERRVEYRKTLDAAIRGAKQKLAVDVYGAVRVTKQVALPGYPVRSEAAWDDAGTLEVTDAAEEYGEGDLS